jgi:hypothetical protein
VTFWSQRDPVLRVRIPHTWILMLGLLVFALVFALTLRISRPGTLPI